MLRTILFEAGVRTRTAPMRPGESLLEFHNTSAWTACNQFRERVNAWIADYPIDHQRTLIKKMHEGDTIFRQTLLELVAGASFRNLGFEIEPHPLLAHSPKRPDFQLSKDDVVAYAEVTTNNSSEQSIVAGRAAERLIAGINKISLPIGTFFRYELLKAGVDAPPVKLFTKHVHSWIEQESPSSAMSLSRRISIADWEIELEWISTGSDQKFEHAIGISSSAGWVSNTASEIRKRSVLKANRYGELGAPYILVVGDSKGHVWGRKRIIEEMVSTACGDEIVRASPEEAPIFSRTNNGLWFNKNGPKNTQVSAILFFPNVDLFGLRNELHMPMLAVNPWAAHDVPSAIRGLSRIELENNEFVFKEGLLVADLIGLPKDWPSRAGIP